ncbi:MAG TPA: tetratricopeptide repeat protein [Syntrophales bacterium]|nr:tetratricopeptide repeat protein [Syntrophales bacterium]
MSFSLFGRGFRVMGSYAGTIRNQGTRIAGALKRAFQGSRVKRMSMILSLGVIVLASASAAVWHFAMGGPADVAVPAVVSRADSTAAPAAPSVAPPAPASESEKATRQEIDKMENASGGAERGVAASTPAASGGSTPSAVSVHPLVQPARAEYDGGRYERAAGMLSELLRQNNVDATAQEQAKRLLADCSFHLAEGNNKKLLETVEDYKRILEGHPDPVAGNDRAYFNLAQAYEKLKFYYEAAAAMEKLLIRYPDSPLAADAPLFIGEMNMKTGKLDLAAARLEDFLARRPDHPKAREAILHLVGIHLSGGRIDSALKSAQAALARWPDLSALPADALLNLGLAHYWSNQHAEAIRILSLAASLHPAGEKTAVTLYVLGCTLYNADRPAAAMAVFSRVKEMKPDSWEGVESTLAAANIGLARPDLKVPFFLALAPAFRDPLETYNQILKATTNHGLIERVRFQRAYGLWRKGRHREAYREFQHVVATYPLGAFAASSRNWMMASVEKVLDESFHAGDHTMAAALYFQVPFRDLRQGLNFDRLYRIGKSLAAVGLDADAKSLWMALRRQAPDERARDRLAVSIARLNLERRDTAEATRILQEIRQPGDAGLQKELAALRAGVDRIAGRKSDAILRYGEALNVHADQVEDPFLHRELAMLLEAEGRIPQAIDQYRKALQGFSADPERQATLLADGRLRLADSYLKEGAAEEGMKLLAEVSNTAPDASLRRWSWYRMGRTLEKQGNLAGADKAFAQVKGAGEDEFWGKVADFSKEDAHWSRKFRDVIR